MSTRRAVLASLPAFLAAMQITRQAVAQAAPRPGGVLTAHMSGEQRILNPALRASTGVYAITSKMIEALVDLDAAGKPAPVLATSWESTPDGRTITFRLREGVNWHDGKPFTAADVQYNAMELWKKHLNYGTQLQQYLDAVDTPEPHTAVFRYSRPMPLDLLLRALCDLGYVVPRHLFEGTNVLENPANTAPVGTGPFRFVQYERGQYVIAERNPNHWRGAPPLDRIVWRFITDRSAATAAIETGQIQVSTYNGIGLADLDRLGKDPRFTVTTRGSEANAFNNTLEFNHRRRELADVRVRRAIAHAIDVPFFIENFLYGQGKPAAGPIPSTSAAFFPADARPPYAFDKRRAEALLDEAGFRRGAGGVRFSLRLVPIPNGEDVPLLATFIQQSLQGIGIRVEIVNYDAAGALTAVYRDWNFDLATGWHQYRGDPAVSTTVWYRSGSPKGAPWTNQWAWQSDRVDALTDQAASETDPAKRKALYAEWLRAVNEELPIWMVIERQFQTIISKRVGNALNTPRWGSADWHDTTLAPG